MQEYLNCGIHALYFMEAKHMTPTTQRSSLMFSDLIGFLCIMPFEDLIWII